MGSTSRSSAATEAHHREGSDQRQAANGLAESGRGGAMTQDAVAILGRMHLQNPAAFNRMLEILAPGDFEFGEITLYFKDGRFNHVKVTTAYR